MQLATDEADVLARIGRWTGADDRVRLVIMTSTRTVPGGQVDLLSDYDIVLVVGDLAAFATSDEWLHGFGTPLIVVRDSEVQLGVEKRNCMVLYDDGTKIDHSLWSPAMIEQIRQRGELTEDLDTGYRVLLDKDGVAPGLPPPTHRVYLPVRPDEREYRRVIGEFWFCATYVAKYLWRDELMPVKVILDYEMKYLLVRPMLEWRIGLDHGWAAGPGFFGRRLRSLLDAATWAELEATYVGPGRTENWVALHRTIVLFRRVAASVGDDLGYPYPAALDARMMDYLGQIQRLAGSGYDP